MSEEKPGTPRFGRWRGPPEAPRSVVRRTRAPEAWFGGPGNAPTPEELNKILIARLDQATEAIGQLELIIEGFRVQHEQLKLDNEKQRIALERASERLDKIAKIFEIIGEQKGRRAHKGKTWPPKAHGRPRKDTSRG